MVLPALLVSLLVTSGRLEPAMRLQPAMVISQV